MSENQISGFASLNGTDGDWINFSIWPDNDLLVISFEVSVLNFLTETPIKFNSVIHELPSSQLLRKLVDERSDWGGELVSTSCSISLYRGRWGIRGGIIAECRLSNVGWMSWPDRSGIAAYVLDRQSNATLIKTAFHVSDELFEEFVNQFEKIVNGK